MTVQDSFSFFSLCDNDFLKEVAMMIGHIKKRNRCLHIISNSLLVISIGFSSYLSGVYQLFIRGLLDPSRS